MPEQDSVLEKELNNIVDHLDHHQNDLEADHCKICALQEKVAWLEEEKVTLEVQVSSMTDRLCQCNKQSQGEQEGGS